MFQYALWKHLAKQNNTELVLDLSAFETYKLHKYCLNIFDVKERAATSKEIPWYNKLFSSNQYVNFLITKFKIICARLNSKHVLEKQFNFDDSAYHTWDNHFLEWYWQTEKYFTDITEDLRNIYIINIPPSDKNKETLDSIKSSNSISLHVRRGDYVSNNNTQRIYGTCDLDYYERAISHMSDNITDPVFFVFSDDISWAKENLKIDWKSVFVDRNDADKNYEDLRLMSQCKNNIIANSSFSWRWAWLNNNLNKIVIAPAKWFNNDLQNTSDIIPSSWKKI